MNAYWREFVTYLTFCDSHEPCAMNMNKAPSVTTSSSTAAGSSLRQNWPAGPADAPVEDAAARLHQMRVQENSSQPQQQQQRQVAGVEDTYRLLRGDAVKLSHKYRRATKRCAWKAWYCSHGKAWD